MVKQTLLALKKVALTDTVLALGLGESFASLRDTVKDANSLLKFAHPHNIDITPRTFFVVDIRSLHDHFVANRAMAALSSRKLRYVHVQQRTCTFSSVHW